MSNSTANATRSPDQRDNSRPLEIQKATQQAAQYIASCQLDCGAILWEPKKKLDPWDHVEAAMGLTCEGYYQQAKAALTWLADNQNTDGSWYAKYFDEDGGTDQNHLDKHKIDTNFVAYVATGVWHYFLITRELEFVKQIYPCIRDAINFVVQMQSPEGDVQWAISEQESLPKDALITACSSIAKSFSCAINLATLLNQPSDAHQWQQAYQKLANALKHKPWRFDRTWEPKTRFSMDWFYPILAGVYSPSENLQRLAERWHDFIEPEFGCRCVSDQPWITIAESCEWIIALVASKRRDEAKHYHKQLLRWQDSDGGFWTGYNFKNQEIWPVEKTSWTAAAFILAADAIYKTTPAHQLFTRSTERIGK